MVWVGQVKVGRLSNGILLNIDNIPSKCPVPERNCFPKSGKLTPHHDKNTLKLAYLWSSSDLHWHDITSMLLPWFDQLPAFAISALLCWNWV